MSIIIEFLLRLPVFLICAVILKCMTAKVGGGYLAFWQACVIMLISSALSYIPFLGLIVSFVTSCILVYKWGACRQHWRMYINRYDFKRLINFSCTCNRSRYC